MKFREERPVDPERVTIAGDKTRVNWWRLMYVVPPKPESVREAWLIFWGADIFYWRLPLLKTTLVLDALIAWWVG